MALYDQPLYNDKHGIYFVDCIQTAWNASENDPCPVQRLMFVSYEKPSIDRCLRINRETLDCFIDLANKGEATFNDTAHFVVERLDIWGSSRHGPFKVSPDNNFLLHLSDEVEADMAETTKPAEVE